MSKELELAQNYINAANAKDVAGCVAMFTEDGVMDSPMGPKKGHAAIKGMLNFLLRMSGDKMADPTLVDGVPTMSFKTPGGRATMRFYFEDDKIKHLKVDIG